MRKHVEINEKHAIKEVKLVEIDETQLAHEEPQSPPSMIPQPQPRPEYHEEHEDHSQKSCSEKELAQQLQCSERR